MPGRPEHADVPSVMEIFGFIGFGLVVGIIARVLVPGRQNLSLKMTVVLGVIGSVVGGFVASSLGTGDVWELNFLGAAVAVVASVLLIVLGQRLIPGGR